MIAARRHHQTLIPLMSGCGGLVRNGLVAEYRFDESKNLLKYSQQFDNAAWTKSRSTVTANATTAPDGTTTADKIIEKTDTDQWYHVYQAVASLTDSTVYTGSVYAKAGERTWIALKSRDKNNAAIYSYFNLSTGVKGTTGSGHTANMISSGDGWYRCSISWNVNTGATTPEFIIMIAEGDADHTYNGDGTSGIYIWGAQLEQGSVARTYYPTRDKQLLMDYSRPRKNLLLPNQANACEDGTTTGIWGSNSAAVSASTEQKWQGSYSLKVVTPNAKANEGFTTAAYPVYGLNPNTTYTATAYIRGASGGETVKAYLYEQTDSNGAVNVSISSTLTLTTEWQRISISRAFGTTGRSALFSILTATQQAATFYVDGLQLEEGATATAWEAPPNIGICGSTTGRDTNDPTWTGLGASFTTDDMIPLPTILNGVSTYTVMVAGSNTTEAAIHDLFAVRSNSSTAPVEILVRITADDKPLIFSRGDGGVSSTVTGASTIGSTPFVLTGIRNGNTITLYNGITSLGSDTDARGTTTVDRTAIGAGVYNSTAGEYHKGAVYYVAIYSRALTKAEINQNYAYLRSYLLRERGIQLS